tara:strand:- start:189 stop:353 length:165 start_codon:yes stop_codon:yes gene_type:complete
MRYRSVRPDDAGIREAMKTITSESRLPGYRRIPVMRKLGFQVLWSYKQKKPPTQ